MKLRQRHPKYDSWWAGGQDTPYARIGRWDLCHIQRKPSGKYGFNALAEEAPKWVGPAFDSPEEAALWACMTGALTE